MRVTALWMWIERLKKAGRSIATCPDHSDTLFSRARLPLES